jgi:PPOX class probable F420-dependent enzyme
MPKGQVPARFFDILESKTLAHLATVDESGRPQVNPVWFIWDGEHVLLSIRPVTRKYRNLMANPAVAMSFLDLYRPQRYLEIRGEAVHWQLYEDLTWVNELARKYTGADYTRGFDGEQRYKVTVQVNSWTAQG